MATVTLTPGTLPPPACYADEQDRFDAYVAAIIATITGTLQWTASDVAPVDLTQYWLRTDGSNPADPAVARGLELLKWSVPDGAWTRVFAIPNTTGTAGGAADAYTLTHTPPYLTTASAYRVGQVYVFKAIATNTGASTLNVDGLGTRTIKKRVTVDLEANDILADQMVSVMFDGTNFQLISMGSRLDAAAIAPGTEGQFLRTVGGVTVWAGSGLATTLGALATGTRRTVAHGLGATPTYFQWRLRCTDAGGDAGFTQNQEVDAGAFYETVGGSLAFVAHCDATNLYLTLVNVVNIGVDHPTTGAPSTSIDITKWQSICYYSP